MLRAVNFVEFEASFYVKAEQRVIALADGTAQVDHLRLGEHVPAGPTK